MVWQIQLKLYNAAFSLIWYIYHRVHQGRPWLTRGPVRGMEWGPPRSVCNGVTGGGGGGGVDSVRRGARGPVRPHQLHRPKDGPGVHIGYNQRITCILFKNFFLRLMVWCGPQFLFYYWSGLQPDKVWEPLSLQSNHRQPQSQYFWLYLVKYSAYRKSSYPFIFSHFVMLNCFKLLFFPT